MVERLPAGEFLYILTLCSWIVSGRDDAVQRWWLEGFFPLVMRLERLPTTAGVPGPRKGKGKGLPEGKGKGKGQNEGKGQGPAGPAGRALPGDRSRSRAR